MAVDLPRADIVVDADLVAALVREQFPALAGEVRHVAQGWENDIFRLGERLAVRLPSREDSAVQVEKECRWLPGLAPSLPIGVPAAVAVGRPGDLFPWSWSIVPWFEGVPSDSYTAAERAVFAEQIADVVLALHSPAPNDAPFEGHRGYPLVESDDLVRRWITTAPATEPERDGLLAIWTAGLAAGEWPGPRVWLHNDLHPANLIVDPATGLLAAVIDFGDLGSGDPACDLAVAWMTFDAIGRARFRRRIAAADRYDEATWIRARAVSASMAAITLTSPNPRTVAMGRQMIEQTLAP